MSSIEGYKILKVLESKSNYNKYKSYINTASISQEIQLIFNSMEEFFSEFPTVEDIDWEEFNTWFFNVKNSRLSSASASLCAEVFKGLSSPIASSVHEAILDSFLERDVAMKIGEHCYKLAEGDDSKALLDVENYIQEYKDNSKKVLKGSVYLEDTPFEELFNEKLDKGLEWRLEELNKSVGSVRKGDFVVIAAYSDSGKTTMLASEATHMAPQLKDDEVVVWINNEEGSRKVRRRIYQAALGWTNKELYDNPMVTLAEVEKVLGHKDRIQLYDNKAMTVWDIEDILSHTKAGLIIIDQLWKVGGFDKGSFSETDKLGKLFGWARKIAQEVAPVINVHQADASTDGLDYIGMNQLYASKVALVGEADAIITIGRRHDAGVPANVRYIYTPKNKMGNGPRAEEQYRNAKWEVEIKPEIARYESVVFKK